jgi:hypothetical protein
MAVPSSSFTVDNPGAGVGDTDADNRYTVCARSGFKARPGELVQESYTKLWVLPEFSEPAHPSIYVRSRPEQLNRGALRPDDTGIELFVSTSTAPSDL